MKKKMKNKQEERIEKRLKEDYLKYLKSKSGLAYKPLSFEEWRGN